MKINSSELANSAYSSCEFELGDWVCWERNVPNNVPMEVVEVVLVIGDLPEGVTRRSGMQTE